MRYTNQNSQHAVLRPARTGRLVSQACSKSSPLPPNINHSSYDTLQNVTRDLVSGRVTNLDETTPVPEQNSTLLTGTFPSRNPNNTAFGSVNGAVASWHFLQSWFQEFPHYLPNDTRISLAAQSYGGRYGPAMMSFWEEQNQRIENGTWDGSDGEQFILHLDTLMIVSGCIDRKIQYPYYPQQAFRDNGFGIEAVNETIYNGMVASVPECLERIQKCRDAAAISDPENLGIDAGVNAVCEDAETWCRSNIVSPYTSNSGLDYYDISTQSPPSFPAGFHQGFLNREWVQAELGVPLNWTGSSPQASNAYRDIGDYPRDSWLEDLGFLLDNGIKVSLVYGDLDFACPVSPPYLETHMKLTPPPVGRRRRRGQSNPLVRLLRLRVCAIRRDPNQRLLHRRPRAPTR